MRHDPIPHSLWRLHHQTPSLFCAMLSFPVPPLIKIEIKHFYETRRMALTIKVASLITHSFVSIFFIASFLLNIISMRICLSTRTIQCRCKILYVMSLTRRWCSFKIKTNLVLRLNPHLLLESHCRGITWKWCSCPWQCRQLSQLGTSYVFFTWFYFVRVVVTLE